MMKRQQILIPAFVAIAGLFAACKKNDAQKPNLDATRHALYNQYKDGEIDECLYNGDTVYCAGHNGYDAGAYIYDGFGKQIATCNYAWGLVDAICKQLQSCTVIYRCKNHVTQLPFADVYGLSK